MEPEPDGVFDDGGEALEDDDPTDVSVFDAYAAELAEAAAVFGVGE